MTWVRRGQRLVRVAAAAYRGGQAVATPRLLSAGPTLIPATSVPLSPAVRYLVDTNSLDPSLIPASGPHSRLLKGDVLWYMETGMGGSGEASSLKPTKRPPSSTSPSPPPVSSLPPSSSLKPSQPTTHTSKAQYTDVAVDDSHRSRAFTSVQSKMSLPHTSASIHCQVGPLLSSLQHNGRERAMLLLESHFIKAAASTLKQFPHSNAVWNEDGPLLLPSVNISVRVLSEGILLPTPVIIRDANRASVQSIASVIERATAGTEDGSSPPVTSASLMVSSLVSSSLSHYTDLVQSPHSAALSLAGVQKTFSEGEESSATVAVCLSCDSRVLNSDLASQWLQQFKANIEII